MKSLFRLAELLVSLERHDWMREERGILKWKWNENESLLIPTVQHDIYHRINFKNKIDLRLT